MSSLRDGLGQEEVLISGLPLSGTNAAYVHPYFIGSVTSEMGFSGANAAFTGSIVTPSGSFGQIQTANLYGNTLISGATVKADYISGATIRVNNEGLLHSVSIGSPTAVYGAKIQAGSGTLSAGSADWVVYPVAYIGIPSVVVANTKSADKAIAVLTGSLTIGSAYIVGEAAADTFSWISVGI